MLEELPIVISSAPNRLVWQKPSLQATVQDRPYTGPPGIVPDEGAMLSPSPRTCRLLPTSIAPWPDTLSIHGLGTETCLRRMASLQDVLSIILDCRPIRSRAREALSPISVPIERDMQQMYRIMNDTFYI